MALTSAPHAQRTVAQLDLHPRIHAAVKKAGLHQLSAVLAYSSSDLGRRTGLSLRDTELLLTAASRALLPSPHTALQLYRKERVEGGRLSTGCSVLDSTFRGGLLVPGVTEIAGTSAAGKTQLSLQLCLSVQLPRSQGGLEGGAAYICTEDAFPHKRLQQLAEAFARKHRDLCCTAKQLSDNIFVDHAATISSLSVQLQYKLPALLRQHKVRLVVVDSMAALFRVEFTCSQAPQRAQLLRSFGAQLRRISNEFACAVVCVNQVTADMDVTTNTEVKPALGLAWADMVTVRIVVLRPETVGLEQDYQKNPARVLRTLQVAFAPHLPPVSILYYIDSDGVHGVTDSSTRTRDQ